MGSKQALAVFNLILFEGENQFINSPYMSFSRTSPASKSANVTSVKFKTLSFQKNSLRNL